MTEFKGFEEEDKVLFNDKAQPLTVKEANNNHIIVEGPKGGAYEIYTDEDTTLTCKKGNRRYSSYCKDLRKVGKWVKDGKEWQHSISEAKVWIEQDENGFWSVESDTFEVENPRYGFSSKEFAVEEVEDVINNHPAGEV